jgi:hypothetical protein
MLAVVAESSYRCALTAASRFSFSPLEGGIPFSHPSVLNRCLASPVPGRGLRLLPPLPPSLTLPHHHHLLSPGLATTTEPSADERAPITSLLPIMPLFSRNVRPAVCHTNNFHCFRLFVSPPAFFNVRLHHLFAPPHSPRTPRLLTPPHNLSHSHSLGPFPSLNIRSHPGHWAPGRMPLPKGLPRSLTRPFPPKTTTPPATVSLPRPPALMPRRHTPATAPASPIAPF